MTTQEAAKLLQSWDNVLILTHRRPDGDTIGCAAALCAALRSMEKTAYLLKNDEITRNYLPYAQDFWAAADWTPDKVVSVDIAAVSLFLDAAAQYRDRVDLAIDHHASYEGFGRESCVEPGRAACGEILFDIISHMCPLTPAVALPLYVAVSTDTGCFVYSNTTANTHRVAAALMETGIAYREANKLHFRTKTRKRLALEAAMAEGMEFFDEGRIVVMEIPRTLMEQVGADESDAEDLSSLAGLVEGNDCAITMRELSANEWKISIRTGPRINASNACRLYEGGGHKAAAGCTVLGSAQEVKEKIVAACMQVAER